MTGILTAPDGEDLVVSEDELAAHIAESMKDPAYREAYLAAEERHRTGSTITCPWGWCTVDLDFRGRIYGGMGPVLCPCDHLPGWRATYLGGMGKPPVPAKSTGRHGSRVQRSRRRHRLPHWDAGHQWLGVNR